MEDKKIVVLFSGGIDSLTTAVMLLEQKKKFTGLYVDFGHRYATAETAAVYRLSTQLEIDVKFIELTGIGEFEKEDSEIPFRNLIILELAAMIGAKEIYISVEEGSFENVSRDRSPEFFRRAQELLNWMQREDIKIWNLLSTFTKQDEVEYVLNSRKDARELLSKTFSCYGNHTRPCGRCKACCRTFLAGIGAGFERSDWISNPLESGTLQSYIIDTKQNKYSGRRGKQYLEVFKKLRLI